jgi:hypothetical protein
VVANASGQLHLSDQLMGKLTPLKEHHTERLANWTDFIEWDPTRPKHVIGVYWTERDEEQRHERDQRTFR